MFLPLRDHNPTQRMSVVTMALIGINVLVWLLEVSQGNAIGLFIAKWGATPYELTHFEDLVGPVPGTPIVHAPGPFVLPVTAITSMFLHGGWAHLIFNMLYLWIFGNNIEDFLGRGRFILFYLGTGLVGLLAHVFFNPNSMIPTVGASGAISGVLGAYLVLYPQARVTSLLFLGFFIQFVEVPAIWLLGVWALMQILGGLTGLGFGSGGGGVAYWAHIGGFVAGFVAIRWLGRKFLHARKMAKQWHDSVPGRWQG